MRVRGEIRIILKISEQVKTILNVVVVSVCNTLPQIWRDGIDEDEEEKRWMGVMRRVGLVRSV